MTRDDRAVLAPTVTTPHPPPSPLRAVLRYVMLQCIIRIRRRRAAALGGQPHAAQHHQRVETTEQRQHARGEVDRVNRAEAHAEQPRVQAAQHGAGEQTSERQREHAGGQDHRGAMARAG
ncbi:MAG TPA: hypothetical protein VF116_02975 [Ktedonobacterales bacterium]